MKRSYLPVALLLAVLMLNIIFTQYMVHQYFYENYTNTIIAAVINVILFPIAFLIYKKGVNVND
jgi:multisubunit Na+/H+ antiporter MnhB subunit